MLDTFMSLIWSVSMLGIGCVLGFVFASMFTRGKVSDLEKYSCDNTYMCSDRKPIP